MFSREQITKSVVQSTSRKIISCLIRRKRRAFIAKCNSLTQTLQANWKCWVCVTAPSASDLFIFKLVSVTLKPWLRARWMLLSKCNYQLYVVENPCRKKKTIRKKKKKEMVAIRRKRVLCTWQRGLKSECLPFSAAPGFSCSQRPVLLATTVQQCHSSSSGPSDLSFRDVGLEVACSVRHLLLVLLQWEST